MKVRLLMVGLVTSCLLVPAVAAAQDASEKAFAEGDTLLQKGDFEGALEAYKTAAREAPGNKAYSMRGTLIERVIAFRARHDSEKDDERWVAMASALHAFYHQNKVYGEALKLDKKLHAKVASADSAAMLARTHLALDQNAETIDLLADFEDETVELKTLEGIALAREGELESAKELAAAATLDKNATPDVVYDRARLLALVGEKEEAVGLLRQVFEATPPSRLDDAKAEARLCSDFAPVKSSDAFAAAMKVKSKIPESSCSTGTSCGKCPSRSKCGSAKPAEKKTGCNDHEKP